MPVSTREQIVAVFDALDAEVERLCGLSFDVLTTPERLRALERCEQVARRLRAPQHAVINQLAGQASKAELGGTLARHWLTGCALPEASPGAALLRRPTSARVRQ